MTWVVLLAVITSTSSLELEHCEARRRQNFELAIEWERRANTIAGELAAERTMLEACRERALMLAAVPTELELEPSEGPGWGTVVLVAAAAAAAAAAATAAGFLAPSD